MRSIRSFGNRVSITLPIHVFGGSSCRRSDQRYTAAADTRQLTARKIDSTHVRIFPARFGSFKIHFAMNG